jgi:hypothetical protein
MMIDACGCPAFFKVVWKTRPVLRGFALFFKKRVPLHAMLILYTFDIAYYLIQEMLSRSMWHILNQNIVFVLAPQLF